MDRKRSSNWTRSPADDSRQRHPGRLGGGRFQGAGRLRPGLFGRDEGGASAVFASQISDGFVRLGPAPDDDILQLVPQPGLESELQVGLRADEIRHRPDHAGEAIRIGIVFEQNRLGPQAVAVESVFQFLDPMQAGAELGDGFAEILKHAFQGFQGMLQAFLLLVQLGLACLQLLPGHLESVPVQFQILFFLGGQHLLRGDFLRLGLQQGDGPRLLAAAHFQAFHGFPQ